MTMNNLNRLAVRVWYFGGLKQAHLSLFRMLARFFSGRHRWKHSVVLVTYLIPEILLLQSFFPPMNLYAVRFLKGICEASLQVHQNCKGSKLQDSFWHPKNGPTEDHNRQQVGDDPKDGIEACRRLLYGHLRTTAICSIKSKDDGCIVCHR